MSVNDHKINACNFAFRLPRFLSSPGRVSGRHNRVKPKIDVLVNKIGLRIVEEISAFRLYFLHFDETEAIGC